MSKKSFSNMVVSSRNFLPEFPFSKKTISSNSLTLDALRPSNTVNTRCKTTTRNQVLGQHSSQLVVDNIAEI